MILAPLLALLIQAQPAPEGDLIVVTAERRKCSMKLANRVLSDPEFKAHLAEWRVGRPLRVYAPAGASYKCLAKIVFKLNDKGVTNFRFVDHPDAP